MLGIRILPAIGSLTLATSVAAARDIHVQHLEGTSTWVQDFTEDAGEDIEINDTQSRTYRVFVDDPASESIGTVTINSQSSGTPTLFIGKGRTEPSEIFGLGIAGCYNLGGIEWSGGRPRLQAYIYNNVTSNISMWHIFRIDVGNELQGDVIHDGGGVSPAPRLGFIGALRIIGPSYHVDITAEHGDVHRVETMDESYAHVTSDNGSIDEIEATTVFLDGGWYGDVLAPNGFIGTVRCPNGGIGFLGEGKVRIEAKNGIDKVFASGDIHADIKSNVNSGSGSLISVRTSAASQGGFTGSIETEALLGELHPQGGWEEFGIDFYGVAAGDVLVNGSLTAPIRCYGLASDYTIKIREGVDADAFLQFGVSGDGFLDGQVIINAADDSHQWLGTAAVGETPLSDRPYYTQNSRNESFEGAIGLAPFHMHNEGCSPPNIEGFNYIHTDDFHHPDTGGVIIRYYGPIHSPTGGSGVVNLAKLMPYQDPEDEESWMDDVEQYFTIELNPEGVSGAPRSIRIKSSGQKNPIPFGRYRAIICDECLQCVGVDGLPGPVSVEYHFWIGANCFQDSFLNAADFLSNPVDCRDLMVDCNCNGILDSCDIAHGGFPDDDVDGIPNQCEDPCPCDWNNSGTLNSQDFFDFLACFFGTCPPGRDADFTMDGNVNSQDFFEFLHCFFAGC